MNLYGGYASVNHMWIINYGCNVSYSTDEICVYQKPIRHKFIKFNENDLCNSYELSSIESNDFLMNSNI